MSNPEPVAGHRAKYEHLIATLPPEQVANEFVGGGDPALTGFMEVEVLRRSATLKGSRILDIGCGIGRLAKCLFEEDISGYLGLDIIPEILQQAIESSKDNPKFQFAIVKDAQLPAQDSSFDIVCGFSLITHLVDEEIFEYFLEARRVLRTGGTATFSFLDLDAPHIGEIFVKHARTHRHGHGDLLRFMTRPVLARLADLAGFASTSFVDGQANIVSANRRRTLIDGRASPSNGCLGQSICIIQA